MINWANIPNFKREDFSEDPDRYADPKLIQRLQWFRTRLGKKMYPSPAQGALARFDGLGTSQHYAVNRLSTALDLFIEGMPIQALLLASGSGLFGGIGVYLEGIGLNGAPWVRFHLDIRRVDNWPLIWINVGNDNFYPERSPQDWKLLRDWRLYEDYKL